jgi:hypothetical protein
MHETLLQEIKVYGTKRQILTWVHMAGNVLDVLDACILWLQIN